MITLCGVECRLLSCNTALESMHNYEVGLGSVLFSPCVRTIAVSPSPSVRSHRHRVDGGWAKHTGFGPLANTIWHSPFAMAALREQRLDDVKLTRSFIFFFCNVNAAVAVPQSAAPAAYLAVAAWYGRGLLGG